MLALHGGLLMSCAFEFGFGFLGLQKASLGFACGIPYAVAEEEDALKLRCLCQLTKSAASCVQCFDAARGPSWNMEVSSVAQHLLRSSVKLGGIARLHGLLLTTLRSVLRRDQSLKGVKNEGTILSPP